MTIIKSILESHSPHPDKPLFEFAMTSEAAEKNFLILKSFDFDMKRALEAQANSPMGYGSEFRKGDIAVSHGSGRIDISAKMARLAKNLLQE